MTGQKNRFKPLDSLLKLDDKQLTTPKHDEMIVWLLNKENIKLAFSTEIEKVNKLLLKEKNKLKKELQEIEENPELYNQNRDVNWDSEATVRIDELKQEINGFYDEVSIKLTSEAPVLSSYNNFIIGYWDLVIKLDIITPEWKKYLKNHFRGGTNTIKTIYVEVKPKIESFGATLRQLRTYQQYIPKSDKGNIVLFTADPAFKDSFESQGIKVILPSDLI